MDPAGLITSGCGMHSDVLLVINRMSILVLFGMMLNYFALFFVMR